MLSLHDIPRCLHLSAMSSAAVAQMCWIIFSATPNWRQELARPYAPGRLPPAAWSSLQITMLQATDGADRH